MVPFANAVQDFRRARSRANLKELLGRLTGRSNELFSYEDVRQKLHASGIVSRRLENIPINRIVGSVGRYHDFSRDFLPLSDSDLQRWARVRVAVSEAAGVPPIEVYQIGELYFVQDGHHRVSVAREMGAESIEAYVTEVRTRVPLTAGDELDDLLIKAEYSNFLKESEIDKLRPGADLSVTCPGQYRKLRQHIEVHRYYMGIEEAREIPYDVAVGHWYDTVYLPVIRAIRDLGILEEYPHRTEADLYLWIGDHRAELEQELQWDIQYIEAAADVAGQSSSGVSDLFARLGRLVGEVVRVEDVGVERDSTVARRRVSRGDERLFPDVLVALDGRESGWLALEQAIVIARREDGRVRAVHAVAEDADLAGEIPAAVRERFEWRMGEVGLPGSFTVEVGTPGRVVCALARFSDLVVAGLNHPPVGRAPARLGSGYRRLLKRCSRPVLATPGLTTPMTRPLLAYDDSAKGREALYVAAYLATSWGALLEVVHVADDPESGQQALQAANDYLRSCAIEASYRLLSGAVVPAILEAAADRDTVIIGADQTPVVAEILRPTTVDEILDGTKCPVLVCT